MVPGTINFSVIEEGAAAGLRLPPLFACAGHGTPGLLFPYAY